MPWNDLDSLNKEDIQTLIEEGRLEGVRLDYKAEFDLKGDLLEDIVAFANTQGGDIVIGVREEREGNAGTGKPKDAPGIAFKSRDSFKLQVENSVRDLIAPQIVGMNFGFADVEDGKTVVVIRVPRSHQFHMLRKSGAWYKSLARNAAGNYSLDYVQIRQGLIEGDQAAQKLRLFRTERLNSIASNRAPVELFDAAKVVIHVVPQASLISSDHVLSFTGRNFISLKGPFTSLLNQLHNFDGFLGFAKVNGLADAYIQLFRNGTIESVECGIGSLATEEHPYLNHATSGYIINGLHRIFATMRELNLQGPVYVCLSLVGVSNYAISSKYEHHWKQKKFRNDIILLPEVEFQEISINHSEIASRLRSVFDMMYQSSGWAGDFNFSSEGQYKHRLGEDYLGF